MDHIKDVLASVVGEIEKKKEGIEEKIYVLWEKITGTRIQSHTKPYRVKKKTLYVKVDSAPWMYELNQRYKRNLIKKINKELSDKRIDDIVFTVSDFD